MLTRIDPVAVANLFKLREFIPSYEWIYLKRDDGLTEACVTGTFLVLNGYEKLYISKELDAGSGNNLAITLTGSAAYVIGLQTGWCYLNEKEVEESKECVWNACSKKAKEKYGTKEAFLKLYFEGEGYRAGLKDGTAVRDLLNFGWQKFGALRWAFDKTTGVEITPREHNHHE